MNDKKLKEKLNKTKHKLAVCKHHLALADMAMIEYIKFIGELEKQLDQQDLYLNRKDQEFNVLKRMYRDDIINNYVEPRHE